MAKLDEVIERPRRHWIEDGAVELMLGLLFFLTGVIFLFGHTLMRGSNFVDVYTLAVPCVCGVVWVTCMWGLKRLKERVVVPRAGYVTVSESAKLLRYTSRGMRINSSSKMLPLATVMFVGFWGWAGESHKLWAEDQIRWGWIIGLSLAVWLAICFVWTAFQFKGPRYLWLAALSLAVGYWLARSSGGPNADVMVMMTWVGGGTALIGALRLRSFLIDNPLIEDGTE